MPTCQRSHSDNTAEAIAGIRRSQRMAQRHKCAACAYEKGYTSGFVNGLREAKRIVDLLIGQGLLRSEDAKCMACGDPHLGGSHVCRS